MIILFFIQLFLGTLIVYVLFGKVLITLQRAIGIHKFSSVIITTTILTVIFNCMIAYYYSESIDLYVIENGGKIFALIPAFFLLTFMLHAPVKYCDTKEESGQALFAGISGTIFFIVIRFLPDFGDIIFGWLPVVIWV